MRYEKLPNGNLYIKLEPEDQETVSDLFENATDKDTGFLVALLEYAGWSTNGQLFQVNPEAIGALTDAPIITDDDRYVNQGELNNDGKPVEPGDGNIWWFPGYEMRSFGEELLRDGFAIFTLAPSEPKA